MVQSSILPLLGIPFFDPHADGKDRAVEIDRIKLAQMIVEFHGEFGSNRRADFQFTRREAISCFRCSHAPESH